MKKKLLVISFLSFLILLFSSCKTQDSTNPLMDDLAFTNYVPWWDTNDAMSIINTNITEGEDYEYSE